MNNTELRDSIAKEITIFGITESIKRNDFDFKECQNIIYDSFKCADLFMEEKLRREGRHYLGKVNDEKKS